MSTIETEQDAIRTLCREITNMDCGLDAHYNECGDAVTGAAVFEVRAVEEPNKMLWMQTFYKNDIEKAYLPQLRLMRHRLEELYREALAQREDIAA